MKTTYAVTSMPAIMFTAGEWFCMALNSNDTVVVWGDNGSGQTNVPAGLTNIIAIAAGSDGRILIFGQPKTLCPGRDPASAGKIARRLNAGV
jgi:hypothetical protein